MMHLLRQQHSSFHPCRHLQAARAFRAMAILPVALCIVAFLVPVVPAQSPIQDAEGKLLADGIAAIVNTEIITVSEVQTEMGDEIFRLKARYEGDELTEHLSQKRYEILNRMIEHKLQLQEAKAKQITVGDEELEQVWEQVRRNPAGFPSAAIQSKAVLREELMVRRVRDMETRRGLFVSPEEIRAYYKEQQSKHTLSLIHISEPTRPY